MRIFIAIVGQVSRSACVERKGASLQILDMNLDTASSTGRLMLNVIGSVAQYHPFRGRRAPRIRWPSCSWRLRICAG
jgi:hypothetical protein